ncbi:MAG: MBOAT family O-acyltransferase [Pseudomonadota bacterium]
MVFSDRTFLFLFLPIALGVLFLARKARVYLLSIIILSILFYYYSSGILVTLLIGVSLFAWVAGILVSRYRSKILIFCSVAILFLPLAWFKYAFFAGKIIGLDEDSASYDLLSTILLPVGISFYTFQAVSYVIDVWRGTLPADRNIFRFTAYLTFFPQLIAGPIVRYADVATKFANPDTSSDRFVKGIVRFTHGLVKKVLIADTIAPIATACFALSGAELTFATALIGIVAYTLQIYFDFSGYSDMAIGLGLMAGIRFPENFNAPYQARSVTEFWRRWHISLSSWFRDYLYIPLGGNRHGPARTYFNLFIVFLATGLWHGAAWVFIWWGLYHGLFLIGERIIWGKAAGQQSQPLLRWLYLLPVVSIGWLLFRASSMDQVYQFLRALLNPFQASAFTLHPNLIGALAPGAMLIFFVGLLSFVTKPSQPLGVMLERQVDQPNRRLLPYAYTAVSLAAVSVVILSANYSPFLYFRF